MIGALIFSIAGVTAKTVLNGREIQYTSDRINASNVQDAIDELYDKASACSSSSKIPLNSYISMKSQTDSYDSYDVSSKLTGYSSDQTVQPSSFS